MPCSEDEEPMCEPPLDRRSAAPLSRLVRHSSCTLVQQQCGVQAPLTPHGPPAGGRGRVTGEGWEMAADTRVEEPRGHEEESQGWKTEAGRWRRTRETTLPCSSPALLGWLHLLHPPTSTSSGFSSPLPSLCCSLFCSVCFRHCCPFLLPRPVMEGWLEGWAGDGAVAGAFSVRGHALLPSFRCFHLHTFSSSEGKNIQD